MTAEGPLRVRRALVVGAGTMGRGIARWLAETGAGVWLADLDRGTAEAGAARVRASWDALADRGRLGRDEAAARGARLAALGPGEDPPDGADLALEAVAEDLDAKTALLADLERRLPGCALATNTSTLPVSAMQRGLGDGSRLAGLHFFNPAHRMRLVEVVGGAMTPPSLCLGLKAWLEERGKVAVLCRDAPGFIVNRIARNFYGEALRITGGDDPAAVAEHDRALREAGGFPMGPFELMDLIGVDVNYRATESLWRQSFHEPRFAPHPAQRAMVEAGRLGRKSGGGFYPHG